MVLTLTEKLFGVGAFLLLIGYLTWLSTVRMPGYKGGLRLNVAMLFGVVGLALVILAFLV